SPQTKPALFDFDFSIRMYSTLNDCASVLDLSLFCISCFYKEKQKKTIFWKIPKALVTYLKNLLVPSNKVMHVFYIQKNFRRIINPFRVYHNFLNPKRVYYSMINPLRVCYTLHFHKPLHSCKDNRPFESLLFVFINHRRVYYLYNGVRIYENATYN